MSLVHSTSQTDAPTCLEICFAWEYAFPPSSKLGWTLQGLEGPCSPLQALVVSEDPDSPGKALHIDSFTSSTAFPTCVLNYQRGSVWG